MKKQFILIAGSKGLIGKSISKELEKNYNIIRVDKKINHIDDFSYKCDFSNEKSVKLLLVKLKKKNINLFAAINALYPKKSLNFLQNNNKKFILYIKQHLIAYYNFNKVLYDYFSKNNQKKIIINFSSLYGSKIPNFKIYHGTKIKMPIEYSISKSSLIIMNKYFAEWSRYKKKKILFFSISPLGIESNQPKKFKSNYKKGYKAKMILPKLLTKKIIKILKTNNQNSGKNYILTGGAKI